MGLRAVPRTIVIQFIQLVQQIISAQTPREDRPASPLVKNDCFPRQLPLFCLLPSLCHSLSPVSLFFSVSSITTLSSCHSHMLHPPSILSSLTPILPLSLSLSCQLSTPPAPPHLFGTPDFLFPSLLLVCNNIFNFTGRSREKFLVFGEPESLQCDFRRTGQHSLITSP